MKIIKVKVFPNSKNDEVIKENEILRVYVKARAEDGKANRSLIEMLSNYFGIKKVSIRIVKGMKSREKLVKIS